MPGRACDHCGQQEGEEASSVQLKRCGRCERALYCCRDCQRAAWPTHKQACGTVLVNRPQGRGGFELDTSLLEDAVVADLPEPAAGEWRFGRRMERPRLELPFPLTRESFEACLPQLLTEVEFLYNVALTCNGRESAEYSPPHGIFLYSVRKGQRVPGSKGKGKGRKSKEIATKDETRMHVVCFANTGQPLQSGKEKEKFSNYAMQHGIDTFKAQAALFVQEQRFRELAGDKFRTCFEGPVVTALCPGVCRCFRMNMLAGGRRDGRLVRAEPAVETSAQDAAVFISKHPRFYPAP
ncbi:MSS51 mitochondrial [Chlorella sorokiniana]|uniref:MSS51 mitochondrial n=1 Tax=Chlorella sorokiniana TaxID=3076 RepID=A0A2P6TFU3_CHLSO|nr:MSS51 mitochondrial [Chlorella sorokiniana]|eukprot:PRW32982.1 MSS51 mitochondrial [Chlorella sorokiniana]